MEYLMQHIKYIPGGILKTELNNVNLSKGRVNEIVFTGGMFSQTMRGTGDIVRSFFHV